jgi:hypothetical protein
MPGEDPALDRSTPWCAMSVGSDDVEFRFVGMLRAARGGGGLAWVASLWFALDEIRDGVEILGKVAPEIFVAEVNRRDQFALRKLAGP